MIKILDKLSGEVMRTVDLDTGIHTDRLGKQTYHEQTHVMDHDGFLINVHNGNREMDTHHDGSVSDMLGNTLFYVEESDD